MHYYIDGYNLLFRLLHGGKDLQTEREAVIRDLNQKVSLVNIDVTIVFDGTFQIGERTRSHFHHLEILFSGEGETADEYIIDEIKNHFHPHQETVVTSDKRLAMRVRNDSAQTETVEEFMNWLNRSYKNKIRQFKKEKSLPKPSPLSPEPQSVVSSSVPQKEAPLESLTDYYARIFETGWQEFLLKEEVKQKEAPVSQSTKKGKKRTSNHSKRSNSDPFELPQTPEEKGASEEERWLKIFEKKAKTQV